MTHCPICKRKIDIDWKNADFLRQYLTDEYKIKSRKYTGCCEKHQKRIAKAIKRSRHMGIIPYTSLIHK